MTTIGLLHPAAPAIAAEVQTATIHYVSDFAFLAQFFTADGTWTGPTHSGLDIETEGVLSPHDGEIATVQIEVFGQCWVVHWDSHLTMAQVPAVDWFKYYLGHPQVVKVIHNASFEASHLLNQLGWLTEIAPVHDTMAGEYILAEGSGFGHTSIVLDKKSTGLGAAVERRYGIEMDKDKNLRTGFLRRYTTKVYPPEKTFPTVTGGVCTICRVNPITHVVGSKNEHWTCVHCLTSPATKGYRKRVELDLSEYASRTVVQGDLSERQLNYAAFDALWCARLAQDQIAEMQAQKVRGGYGRRNLELLALDSEAAVVIARMELHGMVINREELWWLDQKFKVEEETLREDIITEMTRWEPVVVPDELALNQVTNTYYIAKPGYILPADAAPINPLSGEQMVQRLHEMGIHVPNYSAPELKRLSEDFPLVAKILKWKKLQKATSTYTEPWLEKINPKTGRIHCRFNQFDTATGRLSSSGPNLQNVPSKGDAAEIRDTVEAEDDEWVVITADYSQIELRLIAEKFNDIAMQQAFLQDKDIHAMMGGQIMGIPYETMVELVKAGDKMAKKARTNAKPANFGLGYGAGVTQLITIAWNQYDIAWSTEEAGRIRSAYHSLWAGVSAYHKRTADEIKYGTGDFYRETHDGRVRRMPRTWEDKDGKRKTCYSAAMNHPIQGTSGDITKEAMVMLNRGYMQQFGGMARLFLQVHDELVTYCHKSIANEVLAFKKATMEAVGQKRLAIVPCVVDAKIADRWEK